MRSIRVISALLLLTGLSLYAQDPPGPAQQDLPEPAKTPLEESNPEPEPATEPRPEPPVQTQTPPAQPPRYATIPLGPDGKPARLTLEQIVRMVLDNNNLVRIQQLEILKADTELLKEDAKYAPKVGASYEGYEKRDKATASTIFSGDKINQDTYKAYINKLFSTGTYFQLEASDSRFDSNAGDSAALAGTTFSRLSQPPLHTGALTVTLRQELLKNAFGYSQRRINDIAQNNSVIKREELTLQLTQLVVKTMVDYWSLAISEENVRTSELLLTNTRNIRDITLGKTNLGLAESFEVNQWNALLSQAEVQMTNATLDRNQKRRELLRTLNLAPDLDLQGAGELAAQIPRDIDREKDIALARETRPDLRNIRLQMKNAEMFSEIAENSLLPSMSLGGRLSSRDNGRYSASAFNEVPRGTYPEAGVEFRVEMPLWDDSARVDSRNAQIARKQLTLQETQLERQVEDEIRDGYDRIQAAYGALKKAESGVEQMNYFYGGLLVRYRQGRFTAVAVKNALDSLVQARLALTQARINFNISLVRYELARNTVFKRYNIDINEVLDRLRKN